MTDDEKAAVAWVTKGAATWMGNDGKQARTIERMLAAPRVPDINNHREIDRLLARLTEVRGFGIARDSLVEIITVMREPPKPATKTVYRVQPEGWPFDDFETIGHATTKAGHWLAEDIEVSIRKTVVPA